MPLADTVTVSPGCRKRGGTMKVPHPAGVPVMRQSPGSMRMTELSHSIASVGGVILIPDVRVLPQLPVHKRPDLHVPVVRDLVSVQSVGAHGAEGIEFLPRSRCPLKNWTDREPASLKTV